jgi:hypothetical protein
VKLDAAYVKRIADSTGFDTVQLEKVIRLRQLLIEFRRHLFLRERHLEPAEYWTCICPVRRLTRN